MKQPREIHTPRLYPQPTLLDVLKMETGKLAKYAFGKPTDQVFYVEASPGGGPTPAQEEEK